MTLWYCKILGEPCTDEIEDNVKCLVHGWQKKDHFSKEKNNMKSCAVCGKAFYCEDNILKVCSLACASEMIETRKPIPNHKPIHYDDIVMFCPYCKLNMDYVGYTAFTCKDCHKGFSVRFTDLEIDKHG